MLKTLRFIRTAVARKSILPQLTHFYIKDRKIVGYNGILALGAEIDLDMDIRPNAGHFIKAVDACEGTITVRRAGSDIIIGDGSFSSRVPCAVGGEFPLPTLAGARYVPGIDLRHIFQTLRPFVGTDASRPWSCGILLKGQYAYATNNTILVQMWLGRELPYRVVVPTDLVDRVIEVEDEPTTLQLSESTITIHYANSHWMHSTISTAEWPKVVDELLDSPGNPIPPPEGLAKAVSRIAPFTNKIGAVDIGGDRLFTDPDPEQGTIVRLDQGVNMPECRMSVKQLAPILAVATHIDLSTYPKPILFHGDNLRGVAMGIAKTH